FWIEGRPLLQGTGPRRNPLLLNALNRRNSKGNCRRDIRRPTFGFWRRRTRMANIIELVKPEVAFDPETIALLSAALEEAWGRLLQSGSECTRPAYARAMREVVAQRIIDMAQRGTKDKKELVEGAVRFLAANYRLEKKNRQTSSTTGVTSAALPEISPGSGQSPPLL